MERILLYVEDTPSLATTAAWSLRLAKSLSCRVMALAVIAPDQPRRRDAPSSDSEERAWSLLYEIEDDAFEQNVRISLLLEPGEPLARIVSVSSSYDAELVVASADCRFALSELVRQSTRPVVFVK
ncbi:universal stress protein [candidate division WOR-3 bacterium]|nr:universal stress protein [candidate division WOR-3 bacterium]